MGFPVLELRPDREPHAPELAPVTSLHLRSQPARREHAASRVGPARQRAAAVDAFLHLRCRRLPHADGRDRAISQPRATAHLTFDAAGTLTDLSAGGKPLTFGYDGRGLLARAERGDTPYALPTYSSEGRLYSLHTIDLASRKTSESRTGLLYFAGRPVAQWREIGGGALTFLTTDHLGTPACALGPDASVTWSGGFEPFGRDWQEGSAQSALANGILLRLPGQWDHPFWHRGLGNEGFGADLYYNVHRWYEAGTGRYVSADPEGLEAGINLFTYAASNPVINTDPDGRFFFSPRWTGCPVAWFIIAKQSWQGPHGNRYTHCRASCEIARSCGPDVAIAAGFAKEALDVLVCLTIGTRANCDSAADPQDIRDNFTGIFCLEPCDKRCEPLKGAPDLAR